jgi:hypothetical protein
MMFRILAFLLLPVICLAQVNSTVEKPTGELLSNEISPNEMKRNASFNLDEIKVRWKKAALENCTGVPCVSFSAPGPVTNIVASVTSPTSVRVTFGEPASNGGSPITGYEATATPTSSAPGKRKSSATITFKGDKSPIDITGLTTGQNYIFTVVALNAAGGSPPTVTVTPVTPCTLNTPAELPGSSIPVLKVGEYFGVGFRTTGATGIGTAKGLPDNMIAYWEEGILVIEGTPTVAGTFDVRIPLTGGCGSVEAKGKITVEAAPPLCVLAGNDGIIIPSGTLLGEGLLIGTTPLGVTSIIYTGGLPLNTTIVLSEGHLYLKGQPTSVQTEPFTFFFILQGGVCDNTVASGKFLLEVMP